MNPPSFLAQNPVYSRQSVEAIPAPTVQGDFPAMSPLNRGNGMAPAPPDINGIVLRIRSLLPTLTALEAGVVTGLFKKRRSIFPLLSSGISMGLAGPHKSPAMQPLNFCVLACEPLFLMTAR